MVFDVLIAESHAEIARILPVHKYLFRHVAISFHFNSSVFVRLRSGLSL